MNIRMIPVELFKEFKGRLQQPLHLVFNEELPHYTVLSLYGSQKEKDEDHFFPRLEIYAGEFRIGWSNPEVYTDIINISRIDDWNDNKDMPEGLKISCQIILRAIELRDSGQFKFEDRYRYGSEASRIKVA